MSKYVVDTSVWFTYFRGRNPRLRDLIDTNRVFVSAGTLGEFHDVLNRKGMGAENMLRFIRTQTTIVPIDADVAIEGSKIKQQRLSSYKRFSLIDGIQYATAQLRGAQLLTHDKEFSGLDGVEVLKVR